MPDVVTAFLESRAGRCDAPLPDALRALSARRGSATRCPPTCATASICRRISRSTCASSTRPAPSSRRAATSRRCARSWARPRSCRSPPPARRSSARDCAQWDFGDLPETLTSRAAAQRLTGYPALVDDGDERVARAARHARGRASRDARRRRAADAHRAAGRARRATRRAAPGFAQAALQLQDRDPHRPAAGRRAAAAIVDRAFLGDDPLPRNERAFAEQVKRARTRLPAVAEGAFRLLGDDRRRTPGADAAARRRAARAGAARGRGPRRSATRWSTRASSPRRRGRSLQHLPRYLKALDRRLAKYAERPDRDARHADQVAQLWQRYRERAERATRRGGAHRPAARGVPVAARGAPGVAVRAGAQDALSRCRSSGSKRHGPTSPGNKSRRAAFGSRLSHVLQ